MLPLILWACIKSWTYLGPCGSVDSHSCPTFACSFGKYESQSSYLQGELFIHHATSSTLYNTF